MAREYRHHSASEKLGLVQRYLAGESVRKLSEETGISTSNIHKWRKQYLEHGEQALENKRKPGNPLSKYERKKHLSRAEELEYQVELLKNEAEVVRLKKFIELEGGDMRKR